MVELKWARANSHVDQSRINKIDTIAKIIEKHIDTTIRKKCYAGQQSLKINGVIGEMRRLAKSHATKSHKCEYVDNDYINEIICESVKIAVERYRNAGYKCEFKGNQIVEETHNPYKYDSYHLTIDWKE